MRLTASPLWMLTLLAFACGPDDRAADDDTDMVDTDTDIDDTDDDDTDDDDTDDTDDDDTDDTDDDDTDDTDDTDDDDTDDTDTIGETGLDTGIIDTDDDTGLDTGDTGADTGTDTGMDTGEDRVCDLGTSARPVNLVFGQVGWFADQASLPAGRYRVSYDDGCMKYAPSQAWTVHAFSGASIGWWLVGASTADKRLVLPGTVGISVGSGGYATFEQCVAANRLTSAVEFDHPGGKLGAWVTDSAYADNVPGIDGRSPRWRLERLHHDCD